MFLRGIQILVVLYIILFVHETKGPHRKKSEVFLRDSSWPSLNAEDIGSIPQESLATDKNRNSLLRYISIFNIHQFIDVFKVTFRSRCFGLRRVILTCLVVLIFINVGCKFSLLALFHWLHGVYDDILFNFSVWRRNSVPVHKEEICLEWGKLHRVHDFFIQ